VQLDEHAHAFHNSEPSVPASVVTITTSAAASLAQHHRSVSVAGGYDGAGAGGEYSEEYRTANSAALLAVGPLAKAAFPDVSIPLGKGQRAVLYALAAPAPGTAHWTRPNCVRFPSLGQMLSHKLGADYRAKGDSSQWKVSLQDIVNSSPMFVPVTFNNPSDKWLQLDWEALRAAAAANGYSGVSEQSQAASEWYTPDRLASFAQALYPEDHPHKALLVAAVRALVAHNQQSIQPDRPTANTER
jgi:hypothetical protein